MGETTVSLPRTRWEPWRSLRADDDRLARAAAAGDERAFSAIYERHHQALYRYCRSVVGNDEDARDALQNTMLAALRGLDSRREGGSLKAWLFQIAHNESISLMRRRREHAELSDELDSAAISVEASAAEREQVEQLVSDMRELPDSQRGALVMHELSGLQYPDIAAALGVSAGAARQLVYEARQALHQQAEGREMPCDEVQRAISFGDGRMLRRRPLRAHLRSCEHCRRFKAAMRERPRALALLAPPLAPALAASVLHDVLGSGWPPSGGGGAGGGGATHAAHPGRPWAIGGGALATVLGVAGVIAVTHPGDGSTTPDAVAARAAVPKLTYRPPKPAKHAAVRAAPAGAAPRAVVVAGYGGPGGGEQVAVQTGTAGGAGSGGAASAASSSTGAAGPASGSKLPFTGLDLGLLAAAGAGLLGLGLGLRLLLRRGTV
jgi:RNA polymerase sigma factor (sigma-70 family)